MLHGIMPSLFPICPPSQQAYLSDIVLSALQDHSVLRPTRLCGTKSKPKHAGRQTAQRSPPPSLQRSGKPISWSEVTWGRRHVPGC